MDNLYLFAVGRKEVGDKTHDKPTKNPSFDKTKVISQDWTKSKTKPGRTSGGNWPGCHND